MVNTIHSKYNTCNEEIGNEFHYLFICNFPYLLNLRKKLITNYYTTYPSDLKFKGLLSFCNTNLYIKISCFIRKLASISFFPKFNKYGKLQINR
jgi:hypothetical protein